MKSLTGKVAATALGAAVLTGVMAAPAGAATTSAAPRTAPAVAAPSAARAAGVTEAQWISDVSAALAPARPWIEQRTAALHGERPAIVLDIDNTSLETYFHPFLMPAVQPTLDVVRYAKSRGAAVFFVTARPEFIEPVTRFGLQHAGYPVDGLYGRDLGELFGSVQDYKTASRADIERRGYTIIANIGNNTTDLAGGHAERTFKLPDYDGLLS
ncbi:HAD family acid phosphatase [Kitasatospora sp. NPDC059571]|uniref:HAD family acid phosphatase n=1 Tax=Kitasatospora sp. NPDC059571 TaxID=3346871 RepID=UPI0036B84408